MQRREVVTCFLQHGGHGQHRGRILMLKRSQQVRTYRGRWAGVSGGIEGVSPLEQALREVQEETGLEPPHVRLVRQGPPLEVPDPEHGVEWRVHPFLFAVEEPSRVRLDWEHTEARWVDPGELAHLETVPKLKETWEQLWRTSNDA